MNESKRIKKRIIAIVIIGVVVSLLVFVVYLIAKPNPTCNDGILNQREKGIDCGGPCAPCPEVIQTIPLEVVNTEFVHFEGNKYDALVRIKNQNSLLGAEKAEINVRLLDGNGQVLVQQSSNEIFILPDKEKYVVVYGLETQTVPTTAEAEIGKTSWERFSQYEEPRLVVINKSYEKNSGGAAWFSRAKGTLINKTEIDFEKIKVDVILRDFSGQLLAVNSQVMNTVRAGEQRDFFASFSRSFPGDVADMQVQTETNIFDSENYIKTHGVPEDWIEN